MVVQNLLRVVLIVCYTQRSFETVDKGNCRTSRLRCKVLMLLVSRFCWCLSKSRDFIEGRFSVMVIHKYLFCAIKYPVV